MSIGMIAKSAGLVTSTAPLWFVGRLRAAFGRDEECTSLALPRVRIRTSEFDSIIQQRQPIVLANFLEDFECWPLLRPHAMKAAWNKKKIPVYVNKTAEQAFLQRSATIEVMDYEQFMAAIFEGPANKPVRYYSRFGGHPGLLKRELTSLHSGRQFSHCGFWIGEKDNLTPFHVDPWHGFLGQAVGSKHVILCPPNQVFHLYPRPFLSRSYNVSPQTWLPDDCSSVSRDEFPRFHRAARYEGVIQPGDLLYIPPFYWHWVRSLDNNISVLFRFTARMREMVTTASVREPWGSLLHHLRVSADTTMGTPLRPWSEDFDFEAFKAAALSNH